MTLGEYKSQVFKYDGEDEITIGDVWDELPRGQRRYIIRELGKGRVPNFVDIWLS